MVPSPDPTTLPAALAAAYATNDDPASCISVCRWNTSSHNRSTAGGTTTPDTALFLVTANRGVASNLVAPNGYAAQDGNTPGSSTGPANSNDIDGTQTGVKEAKTGKANAGGLTKEEDMGTSNPQDTCVGTGSEEEEGDGGGRTGRGRL